MYELHPKLPRVLLTRRKARQVQARRNRCVSVEWDQERLRWHTQRLIMRDHADEQAIGVIDESGHPKKETETACVHRQSCGNTGTLDNCVRTVLRVKDVDDDRLGVIELIMELEGEFKVEFPNDVYSQLGRAVAPVRNSSQRS